MQTFESFLKKLRPDHPRMFFNRDTWPEVLRRSETTAREAREEMIARCRDYTDDPHCTGTEAVVFGEVKTPTGTIKITPATPIPDINEFGYEAAECALAWRFTGEPEFLEKARKMLIANGIGYHEAYENRRAVNWYSSTRIMSLCAYDWIYEGLTEEQHREIIVPLVTHVEEIQNRPGRPFIVRRDNGNTTTGFYGVPSLLWFAGLAAYGDDFCGELALNCLKEGFGLYTRLLDYRESSAGDDGGMPSGTPGYSMGAYPWAHFNFFHTFLSAAGENLAADYPALALYPNWIYWIWMKSEYGKDRPVYSGFGDDTHMDNALPLTLMYQHMTQQIHFYKDVNPEAARLALSIRSMVPKTRLDVPVRAARWIMYPFLMDEDYPDIIPFSAEELDNNPLKCRHFAGHGQFHMRSGFTEDATYATYNAGASVLSHKQLDENSFVIRKHDFLAIDSGTRARERDYNLRYYYHETVAHNAMLIHKPDEPFPDTWGPEYDGPEAKTNFGGQYMVSATVLAFETDSMYTYIASDASASYGAKTPECIRQFVHIQPDYFIVYDRVTAEDASYRKEWLLHTVNEPVIDGDTFTADCGRGRLFSRTLLPEDASITAIGGPGKEYWSNGKNWEVEEEFDAYAREKAAEQGHDVYFGAWRAVVSPKEARKTDQFLHVLTASDISAASGVKAERIRTGTRDGVTLTLPDGSTVTVFFNRDGAVGGTITIGDTGKSFTTGIQPQAGIGLG